MIMQHVLLIQYEAASPQDWQHPRGLLCGIDKLTFQGTVPPFPCRPIVMVALTTHHSWHLSFKVNTRLHRALQVWKHTLGSDPEEDVLVFHEADDSFYIGLGESRSKEYLCISSGVRPS